MSFIYFNTTPYMSLLFSCTAMGRVVDVFFRCPCDECSISHMITCGIINPDVMMGSGVAGSSGSDVTAGGGACGSSGGHTTTASSSPASTSSHHHRHHHSQSPPPSHTTGDAPPRTSLTTPPFQHDARYIIDVTPPSMSSTSSSDGSQSPITIDHDRPYTFYNENFTCVLGLINARLFHYSLQLLMHNLAL